MGKVIAAAIVALIGILAVSAASTDQHQTLASRLRKNLPRQCGQYLTNRIIRGRKASLFEFPWMARLVYNEPEPRCSGTLISERYVLSAAVCVEKDDEFPTSVLLGEFIIGQDPDCRWNDPLDCAPPVQAIAIERVFRHQNYSAETRLHDIALIRLVRGIAFDDHIQPICLPVTSGLQRLRPHEYILAGWGSLLPFPFEYPTTLRKASVPADTADCATLIESYAKLGLWSPSSEQICVGANGTADFAMGDFGGPLGQVVPYDDSNKGGRFVQFGVMAYADDLLTWGVLPGIYTNVSAYLEWIADRMGV